ncbi:MAG: Ig-like domain-containing protein, partial [Candidatus Thiodiazotropha sp.]
RKVGNQFELTGDLDDVLAPEDFAPQQIPGALKAFSAMKLIKIPLFSNSQGVEHDLYEVEATARDETGNESTVRANIAVFKDQDPSIVEARKERDVYFPHDIAKVDVQAYDDQAVTQLEAQYYLDGGAEPVHTAIHNIDSTPQLIPAENVQRLFTLDLASLALTNAAHSIRMEITAVDNREHRSSDNAPVFALDLDIQPDTAEPLLGINSPVQGATLYHGDQITVKWKAVDDSRLQQVQFLVDGSEIHSQQLSADTASGEFDYTLPTEGDSFRIESLVVDVYGNETRSYWDYTLISDEEPTVSIRSPAAGSRMEEGESFTMAAQVSDNRRVENATFFIELKSSDDEDETETLFTKSFNHTEITNIQADGSYLTVAMRVPHKPEPGEGSLVIGVRATDDAGLTTEVPLELEILDDEEPPVLAMEEPAEGFSIIPGDGFRIEGSGDDNRYIDNVVPVLVDDEGVETILAWQVFSRSDRVESLTVPNPLSFGTLIVGERFYTDFNGRIEIPQSFLAQAGETYQFKLRAVDLGINTTDTPSVDITILGDEEAPNINIISPPETVYDRQALEAVVQISDNIELESYSVFILGEEDSPLIEASGLSTNSVKAAGLSIDLNAYTPLPDEGANFTLVVEATDSSGNLAQESHLVSIQPDEPPTLSVLDESPESDQVHGDLFHHTLRVNDDYVSSVSPVNYFPVYTSLKGLGNSGSRDPTGHTIQEYNAYNKPLPREQYVTIQYPEAGGVASSLTIDGIPYFSVDDDVITIRPQPQLTGKLLLDYGSGYTTRYHITTYQDKACSAQVSETLIEDSTGVDVSSLSGGDFTTAIIRPEVLDDSGSPVTAYIREIRIDSGSLDSIGSYQYNAKVRKIISQPEITLLLEDQSLGNSATAFLSARNLVQSTSTMHESGHILPLPVYYDIQELSLLGYASDHLSHERDPLALTPLSQYRVSSDDIAPQVQVKAPLNGMSVVPMLHFDIEVEVTDNTQGLRSLQLFENRGTLVREIGGSYERTDYTIPYEVPSDLSGGNLELLLVATDNSGHSTTELLTFPISENEKPQLGLTRFSTYKVGGGYQKILDTPERVNSGEFWVRVGDSFKLDTELVDDAGLERFIINRLSRDGSRVNEVLEEYESSCPEQPLTRSSPSHEIVFDQVEPTEYELILEDSYGNQSVRSILVHPLTNVVPGVRITAPTDGQRIVAGTFRIMVSVVAADDRKISLNDLELYANGVRLSPIGA